MPLSQDRGKSLGQHIKEKARSIVGKVLHNRPPKDIATEVSIDGPLDNSRADTGEVIVSLVQKTSPKPLLPGFVGEARRR